MQVGEQSDAQPGFRFAASGLQALDPFDPKSVSMERQQEEETHYQQNASEPHHHDKNFEHSGPPHRAGARWLSVTENADLCAVMNSQHGTVSGVP